MHKIEGIWPFWKVSLIIGYNPEISVCTMKSKLNHFLLQILFYTIDTFGTCLRDESHSVFIK